MASQLNNPIALHHYLRGSSSKHFQAITTSRSSCLSLNLKGQLGSWSSKLENSGRWLGTPAVSQSPRPLDLNEDDLVVPTNGRAKVPDFITIDVGITDICDSNIPLLANGDMRVLQPIFQVYGQRPKFAGPIVTLMISDDNKSVWELVHSPGHGRVLLIDAGGQKKCAVIGGILTQVAWYMGWAGVVVNGYIRDVDDINAIDMGVRALASHPIKPKQRASGDVHISVNVGGALIHDGEWLYADHDGILVSKSELDIHAAHKYKIDFEARHSIKHKISGNGCLGELV